MTLPLPLGLGFWFIQAMAGGPSFMLKKICVAGCLTLASVLAVIPSAGAAEMQPEAATYRWVAGPTFGNLQECGNQLRNYIDGFYVVDAYCTSGANGEAVMFLRSREGAGA